MAPELETGAPDASVSASQDTSSASPTFETDTPSQGSDSTAASGTDEMATLRSEVEELRKRVSHGSVTAQELQKTRDELKQQQERLAYWRQNGVDPDEIDRALKAARGDQTPAQTSQPEIPKNVMTQEQFNNMMVLRDWNAEKKAWFKDNPDYNTRVINKALDGEAYELAEEEMKAYGAVMSSPEELFKKALAAWNKTHSIIEKRVMQKTTETRTKVNAQGVTDTQHVKPTVDRTKDDATEKFESNEEWLERRRREREQRRRGQ